MTPVVLCFWLSQFERFWGLATKNNRAASGDSFARICSARANVSSLIAINRSKVCPRCFLRRYEAVAPLRDGSAKDEAESRYSKLKWTGVSEPSRMRVSVCSIMEATSGKSGSAEERKSTSVCCRVEWPTGAAFAWETYQTHLRFDIEFRASRNPRATTNFPIEFPALPAGTLLTELTLGRGRPPPIG